jgi:hypothetical protein
MTLVSSHTYLKLPQTSSNIQRAKTQNSISPSSTSPRPTFPPFLLLPYHKLIGTVIAGPPFLTPPSFQAPSHPIASHSILLHRSLFPTPENPIPRARRRPAPHDHLPINSKNIRCYPTHQYFFIRAPQPRPPYLLCIGRAVSCTI